MRASGVFDGRRHLSQRPAFSSDIQIEGNVGWGWHLWGHRIFGGLGVGGRGTRDAESGAAGGGRGVSGGAWVVGRGIGGGREVQPHISEIYSMSNKGFEHDQTK